MVDWGAVSFVFRGWVSWCLGFSGCLGSVSLGFLVLWFGGCCFAGFGFYKCCILVVYRLGLGGCCRVDMLQGAGDLCICFVGFGYALLLKFGFALYLFCL